MASFWRPEILRRALLRISDLKPYNLSQIHVAVHENDKASIEVIAEFNELLSINQRKLPKVLAPGATRNTLLDGARAQWLCFLDDDTVVGEDYFQVATGIMTKESLQVFGGPDQPLGEDIKQNVLGRILGSTFLMGATYVRHSRRSEIIRDADELMLTLCNLWIKRDLLEISRFPENLRRCEENLLLDELSGKGTSMGYFPQLFVHHTRRTKLADILNIQIKSGFYRGLEIHDKNAKFKPMFIIPILTGFLLFLLPITNPPLLLLLIFIHSLINAYISLKIAFELKSFEAVLYSFITCILIHVGFSVGILLGWLRGIKS